MLVLFLLPVRRHVWRWTSERERDKSVFRVASMPGLSGFRNNETGDARANVVTPPLTLVNLVTIGSLATHQIWAKLVNRILRYGDGGGGCTCRDVPPHPWLVESTYLVTPQPTYQIWTQSVKSFLRYRSSLCTCARAEIINPWIVIST